MDGAGPRSSCWTGQPDCAALFVISPADLQLGVGGSSGHGGAPTRLRRWVPRPFGAGYGLGPGR